jgi:DNA-binding transcriptional LysR family regulator
MAPTHRLARQAAVRPSDLQGEALIAPLRSTRLRAKLEESLARAGVEPDLRAETTLSAVACAIAGAGGGVAVVEAFTAELLNGLDAAVRPYRDGMEIDYAILVSARRKLSVTATAFLKLSLQSLGRSRRLRRPHPPHREAGKRGAGRMS